MQAKNHDYTGGGDVADNDALANFRHASRLKLCSLPASVLIRATDKISRLATFITSTNVKVKDESFKDTIIDLINYAIILLAAWEETNVHRRGLHSDIYGRTDEPVDARSG